MLSFYSRIMPRSWMPSRLVTIPALIIQSVNDKSIIFDITVSIRIDCLSLGIPQGGVVVPLL
jgi:hypothetical protein